MRVPWTPVAGHLATGHLATGLIFAPGPALAQEPGPMAWSVGLVIGALVVFVAAMSWLLALLAGRLLAEARAIGAPALVRLTELPCGVPDGTIRALISCFIVIFGFLLIGLQKPLGLASAEALTGFIGAVISFYFVTRNGETRRLDAEVAAEGLGGDEAGIDDLVDA